MATWLITHTPWLTTPVRARLGLDVLPSRLWLQARSHLNIALQTPSPASLEIDTMPYPTAHPDPSVFEPMSNEYTVMSTPGAHHCTPLTSSETLASLVSQGKFQAADALRKEMIAHHIPIPCDALYLRAALHAITQRRLKGSGGSAQQRVDAFVAWLSLVPDRHEEWQSFHDIRQRLFRSMDHLNLTLVYRFGRVLASRGYYSGDAAMQVVSTLARYARPSVVERYLGQVEDASRDYHSNKGTVPPSDLLAGAYNLSVRTVALGGKAEAALALVSVAQSRGIQISDFTLNIVAKHASERWLVIDRISSMYPSWTLRDIDADPATVECKGIPVGQTTDITALAAWLRSLRITLRSPSPPSPHPYTLSSPRTKLSGVPVRSHPSLVEISVRLGIHRDVPPPLAPGIHPSSPCFLTVFPPCRCPAQNATFLHQGNVRATSAERTRPTMGGRSLSDAGEALAISASHRARLALSQDQDQETI